MAEVEPYDVLVTKQIRKVHRKTELFVRTAVAYAKKKKRLEDIEENVLSLGRNIDKFEALLLSVKKR